MEERDTARRKAMEDSRLEAKRIAMAKKSQSEKLIREAQAAAKQRVGYQTALRSKIAAC